MVLKPGTGESFGKKVWKKIKLHGTQTIKDEAQSASEVWKKIKLHGTQTLHACTLQREKFWRRVKLQGSQIFCEEGNGVHAIGKGIELQGAQGLKRRRHLKQTKQCFGSERIAGYSNYILFD